MSKHFSLTSADSSHSKDDPELERRLVENEEKAKRWFSKLAQQGGGGSDANSVDGTDEDFPEIMPLRKGVSRYVVNTRKTHLQRRLANADYSVAAHGNSNRNLNEILGSTSFSLASFSQVVQKEPSSNNPEPGKVRNGKSLEGSLVKEPDLLDMSEEEAERWFKRVAEIINISELSHIPDEDFPSIMPMRKGVNRFVVSKRKTPLERRLASQRQHRDSPPFTDSNPASNRDT